MSEEKEMADQTPKYPNVEVQLSMEDGNAFVIVSRVSRALRQAGVDADEIDEYKKLAMSGTYEDLLRVTAETVTVL